jgi:hypothetical protein
MRFPVIIRHRKAEARIYGKSKNWRGVKIASAISRELEALRTCSEAEPGVRRAA